MSLLGQAWEEIEIYGSGGFTSYGRQQLETPLGDWRDQGFGMVKMKVGREPTADPERMRIAREAIGADL